MNPDKLNIRGDWHTDPAILEKFSRDMSAYRILPAMVVAPKSEEDILETLKVVDFKLSKHELSAFFCKPDNKHYRECGDQILRNFLMGVQLQLRPEDKHEA